MSRRRGPALTDAKGGVARLPVVAGRPADRLCRNRSRPRHLAQKIKAKDDARVVDEQVERNRLYVIDVGKEDGPAEGRRLTAGELSVFADSTPGFDWSPDGKTHRLRPRPDPRRR